MTQFTKDFIKGSVIWTIIFGIILAIALNEYAESKIEDMVRSLSITPLYLCMGVSIVAGSLFSIFISWFVIGRVINGGCLDMPANIKTWLIKYAVVIVSFSALITIWNIIDYKDKVDKLAVVCARLAVSGSYMGSRMLTEITSFRDHYIMIELGIFALSAVMTILSLPLLKRRYDSLAS